MNSIAKILPLAALLPLLLLSGCSDGQKGTEESGELEEGKFEITAEQFQAGAMEIGTPALQTFSREISCRGFLTAPADAMAKVSAPISGAVQSVHFKLGDAVRKGQTLCTVTGNEFLSLQQQYAEAAALYQKAKADFERMKALQAENIGAKKDYLASESLFKTATASYNALKARIQALRIDPLRIENGRMYDSFPVAAPISGHITASGVIIGQYIDPSSEIARVVDSDRLQLRLSVFDADLIRLKPGQAVRYYLNSAPDEVYSAELVTIGKAVNPETKSVDCIAKIAPQDAGRPVSGSYVEAKIVTDQKEALALPLSAVQKEGNEYFAYVVEGETGGKYLLSRTPISAGAVGAEYIEVLSGLQKDTRVVTKGLSTL